MSIILVYNAIETRLKADTGTGGLWATNAKLVTGIFNHFANPNQPMPFVTIDFPSVLNDDTFLSDIVELDIYVNVYVDKKPANKTLSQSAAILSRIYGDSVIQSNRVPTYGLHRHSLSLGTDSEGWVGNGIFRVNQLQSHDDEFFHFVDVYKTQISRSYVAP